MMQEEFNMKKLLTITTLSLLTTFVSFGQSKVGTSAMDILGTGIGADAKGMGGAVVAFSTGPTSLYWNPGAIGLNPKTEVTFSRTNWLVGSKFNWVGATIAASDASAFGFQLAHIAYGDEPVTTNEMPSGTGDRWDANELYMSLSYAQALTDQFSIGTNVKYIRSQIWHETASAFALDLGLLYVTDWKGLRLGMSVSNFGSDMKYDGKDLYVSHDSNPAESGNNGTLTSVMKVDPWPLPIFFRVGVSMEAYKDDINELTVSVDAMRPSNNYESVNVGIQYGFSNMVFLRGGYKNLFLADSQESLAFGLGIKYPVADFNLKFDVSYQKMELFDNIMTYGVSVEF